MWKFLTFGAFTVIWAFTASQDFLELEKTKGSCNTSLDFKSGSFYPDNSTSSITGYYCHWEITSKNFSNPVCLFLNYLFLDSSDEVNVYPTVHDALNDTNPLIPNPIKAQNGSVTVITGLSDVVVTLRGNHSSYIRNFEVYYSHECSSPVPPDIQILHSPIYAANVENITEVTFTFNEIQHTRYIPVFTFQKFDMGNSKVYIDHSQPSIGEYSKENPTDFFMKEKIMTLKVDQKVNSTDNFLLKIHHVDKSCSFYEEINDAYPVVLKTPPEVLNNGTIITECCWLVKHKDPSKILGLHFVTLDFHSVFDIVAVNDGNSEVSPPLLQVTTTNRNDSKSQLIRSGGPYMWISFKPLTYASQFAANVTIHGQGGHLKNSGIFSMHPTTGDDTAFLLEVEDGKLVQLTFDEFSILPPATVSVYDGFDTSHLLVVLHEPAKFPIYSKSSQMMVVGTNFSGKTNKFSAKFKGVSPGCNHMNSLSTESYILSENCNSSCTWIIPPKDASDSELIIYFQYISLKEGDQMDILLLDKNSTRLGHITADTKHLPHLVVPINVGAIIDVTQAACKANKTDAAVLVGHSSSIPGCKHDITLKPSEKLQISSPMYPDTYPLFSTCQWSLTLPKESLVHLLFINLELAENHCVRIKENSTLKYEYVGKALPDDILLDGNITVEFDSSGCDKKQVGQALKADTGFLLNVTVADCGSILDGKMNGEFNTNISGSKSTCMWRINVSAKDATNIVSYTVTKKDELKNYELTVYDGSSVRDSKILNNSNSDIWSRSNVLIFVYKRLNVSLPSSVLVIKYTTITCNSSMLCDNKICLHPDWRCNGNDDCGDFSDEKNCGAAPLPPVEKFTGYTATAFWLSIFAILIIGIIVGVFVPGWYQKCRDSRYTRFRELNGIDS